jgi:glycosyltransferase involved in cell wall biosynthesis
VADRSAVRFRIQVCALAGMMCATPVIAEGLFTYQIGGSERVGVDLALEFKRRGYSVLCFAFHDSDGPMHRQLEAAGVRCLDLNYDRFTGFFRRPKYLWHFWRVLRRERVTALHVHHTAALILCGIPSWLARVKRVVMTEHALQWRQLPGTRGPARHYCRYADEISVVEPAQLDFFHTELGVPNSKLHYVANGVRIPTRTEEAVRRVRQKLQIGPDVFAFFYVGRLEPIKDVGTLLDAFAGLSGDVAARSRLVLVGDGSERTRLEARRDALGLGDRATFIGARSDVSEILMGADAFVMSSTSEGLPMVLLEAMAAGVPCVATAVGGIPQLLADDRGLLVPARDNAELARAMNALAQSAATRSRFVQNATAYLKTNHALDAIVDRYLQLLGLPPAATDAGTAG